MKIELKYGKATICLSLPDNTLVELVKPRIERPRREPIDIVKSSLNNPLNSPQLSELVDKTGPDPSVTITVEDHTRPVPKDKILPPLLKKLIASGVSEKKVTILVATGLHRDLTGEETRDLRKIVGDGPAIVNHNADNPDELKDMGELSYGGNTKRKFSVNRYLTASDITILTGDVEFHYLFGYGGGAKSILPGTADTDSVSFNHSLMDLPGARAGNLDNPLRNAAEMAADLVGVDFSVNVVLSPEKEILSCYSGEVHESFAAAVNRVDELYKVPYDDRAELVIVEAGGYPKDIDLYQAQKAVESGLELVKPGGELVLLAQCPEGWGSSTFRDWVETVDDLNQTEKMIKENFVIGGHKAYIYAKEKRRANLFLVSDLEDNSHLRKIFTSISIGDLEERAIEANSISVLKLGSSTMPVKEKN